MQKQQRIRNRVAGRLDVPNELVVQLNGLVQRPDAVGGSKEDPKGPASRRFLNCIANREARRQEQKKQISDPAVRDYERPRTPMRVVSLSKSRSQSVSSASRLT
jgi:hypothetical protein